MLICHNFIHIYNRYFLSNIQIYYDHFMIKYKKRIQIKQKSELVFIEPLVCACITHLHGDLVKN